MNIKHKLLETGSKIATKAKIDSPKIWTGAVIFGVAATAFLTGMATAKAIKKIDDFAGAKVMSASARYGNHFKSLPQRKATLFISRLR